MVAVPVVCQEPSTAAGRPPPELVNRDRARPSVENERSASGVRAVVAEGGCDIPTDTAARQQPRMRWRFTAPWTINRPGSYSAQALSPVDTADGPCGRGCPSRNPNSHRAVARRTWCSRDGTLISRENAVARPGSEEADGVTVAGMRRRMTCVDVVATPMTPASRCGSGPHVACGGRSRRRTRRVPDTAGAPANIDDKTGGRTCHEVFHERLPTYTRRPTRMVAGWPSGGPRRFCPRERPPPSPSVVTSSSSDMLSFWSTSMVPRGKVDRFICRSRRRGGSARGGVVMDSSEHLRELVRNASLASSATVGRQRTLCAATPSPRAHPRAGGGWRVPRVHTRMSHSDHECAPCGPDAPAGVIGLGRGARRRAGGGGTDDAAVRTAGRWNQCVARGGVIAERGAAVVRRRRR